MSQIGFYNLKYLVVIYLFIYLFEVFIYLFTQSIESYECEAFVVDSTRCPEQSHDGCMLKMLKWILKEEILITEWWSFDWERASGGTDWVC